MLHIYTDGSARKYGQIGGYGIVIFDDNNNLIDAYRDVVENTTNNRMELSAILKTFELLNTKYKNQQATIYSDSAYCINALSSWIYTWSKNNWKNSKNVTIENYDLFLNLYKYYNIDFFISQVNFEKVDGHSGIIGNELADALATENSIKFSDIIIRNGIHIELI